MQTLNRVWFILCLFFSVNSYGAPLDVFLQSKAEEGKTISADVSYAYMDNSLDIINEEKKIGKKTQYKAPQIQLKYYAHELIWFNVDWLSREATVANAKASIDTLAVGAQMRFTDEGEKIQFGAKVSYWTNKAGTIKQNYKLISNSQGDQVSIKNPNDEQYQLDLIGGYDISQQQHINLFAGVGKSVVSFDKISANSNISGCDYDIQFSKTGYSGNRTSLMSQCTGNVILNSVESDYKSNDINPYKALEYKAMFYQLGINWQWQSEHWQLMGGYLANYSKRKKIDDYISSRKKTSYSLNQQVAGKVSYLINSNFAVYFSGQLFNRQFLNEMPMLYNGVSSNKFNYRYGLVSLGMQFTL